MSVLTLSAVVTKTSSEIELSFIVLIVLHSLFELAFDVGVFCRFLNFSELLSAYNVAVLCINLTNGCNHFEC
jgi:hypothetical protein